MLARQALTAARRPGRVDAGFRRTKVATARFYAEHYLAFAAGYVPGIRGAATILDFAPDRF